MNRIKEPDPRSRMDVNIPEIVRLIEPGNVRRVLDSLWQFVFCIFNVTFAYPSTV